VAESDRAHDRQNGAGFDHGGRRPGEWHAEQREIEAERAGKGQQHAGAEAEAGEPAQAGDHGGLGENDRRHLIGLCPHRSQ
jgi:hypothetical protein